MILLSLSRVEVDEHIIPENRVNLAELLHSVRDSMIGRAMKKNMNIKITQPDDAQSRAAPPVILGKHDEITEVFVNLLENAIKYGFDGSDIMLAITMVAPRHVRIDVTNFGEGIEERHLPRLTERFYRVDKARSRQIGGTGLGLAIVKHIVNRHRGSLSITSTLGETTKFSVDLPAGTCGDARSNAPTCLMALNFQKNRLCHKTVTSLSSNCHSQSLNLSAIRRYGSFDGL